MPKLVVRAKESRGLQPTEAGHRIEGLEAGPWRQRQIHRGPSRSVGRAGTIKLLWPHPCVSSNELVGFTILPDDASASNESEPSPEQKRELRSGVSRWRLQWVVNSPGCRTTHHPPIAAVERTIVVFLPLLYETALQANCAPGKWLLVDTFWWPGGGLVLRDRGERD